MSNGTHHVSVCICTYKRPEYLQRLLNELRSQDTRGLFTYSIVVADNDQLRSAEAVVLDFAARSSIPAVYCVEPRQNIALVRNKAVENTTGNFIAFIDDDEFPTNQWLLSLFEACRKYNADGALGPVKPHFDVEPPRWVIESKLHDRPSYPTGLVIDWRKGRTGNVLLKTEIFAGEEQPFRPEFLTGEDQDFFRRMIAKGHRFVWCHEALAYEIVPPIRWKTRFMLRKALLRGAVSSIHPTFGALDIAKSVIAAPVYTVALPFAFIMGQARFMTLLVKLCDHLGKLLACLGVRPIKDAYVTD
jgi:succinoglycan biosynthesis protein ExoM